MNLAVGEFPYLCVSVALKPACRQAGFATEALKHRNLLKQTLVPRGFPACPAGRSSAEEIRYSKLFHIAHSNIATEIDNRRIFFCDGDRYFFNLWKLFMNRVSNIHSDRFKKSLLL